MITIDAPQITFDDSSCVVSAKLLFSPTNKVKTLWLKVDSPYRDFITHNLSDGFLIALLPYALYNNLNIKVTGEISETLGHNFKQIVALIDTIYRTGHDIKLFSNLTPDRENTGSAVITGFSAGVDSFCTLKEYHYCCNFPSYQITHLVFNNVGSHGLSETAVKLFNERFRIQKESASVLGLPLIKVDTNFYSLCPGDFINYQQFGNSAVSHILGGGVSKHLYSSGYDYEEIVHGSEDEKDFANIDAALLPLLSTRTLSIIPVGQQYTRSQKNLLITEIEDTYSMLNVCVSKDLNCSRCFKCVRTMLTLDLLGKLEKYHRVFELDHYYQHRDYLIRKVLENPYVLA